LTGFVAITASCTVVAVVSQSQHSHSCERRLIRPHSASRTSCKQVGNPNFWMISGSTSAYNSSTIATSIHRYWKCFSPAHSSGNNVLNVPNLSLLRTYAQLTHVLGFRFLFLPHYDIAVAAPSLANISQVHVTASTSSSAILT